MPVRLFVGNLPYDTTEEELRQFFSAVGPLSFIHIPKDRETGRPRGFAFVEFEDRTQADEAVRRFNSQPLRGRPLAINEARAREPGQSREARPSYPTQSSPSRPSWIPPAHPDPSQMADTGAQRNFGPDDSSRRNRKERQQAKNSERTSRTSKRERRGRHSFDEDDDY